MGTELTVTAERKTGWEALEMGFRQEWISGEAEGVEVNLSAGAGLGSPWLILTVKEGDADTVFEAIDVRPLLQQWANKVRASLKEEQST